MHTKYFIEIDQLLNEYSPKLNIQHKYQIGKKQNQQTFISSLAERAIKFLMNF